MQAICKNGRLVRFAESEDVLWITCNVLLCFENTKEWEFATTQAWAAWFVEHRFAAILEEDGRRVGLLMGRPCNDINAAGTQFYHYEAGGKFAWVDALIAPDKAAIRLMWEFAKTFAIDPETIGYRNKTRPQMRVVLSEKIFGRFRPEMN